jgi:hypothetical protein
MGIYEQKDYCIVVNERSVVNLIMQLMWSVCLSAGLVTACEGVFVFGGK